MAFARYNLDGRTRIKALGGGSDGGNGVGARLRFAAGLLGLANFGRLAARIIPLRGNDDRFLRGDRKKTEAEADDGVHRFQCGLGDSEVEIMLVHGNLQKKWNQPKWLIPG